MGMLSGVISRGNAVPIVKKLSERMGTVLKRVKETVIFYFGK